MTRVIWSSPPEDRVQTTFLSERTTHLTRAAEDRLRCGAGRALKRRLLERPSNIILQAVTGHEIE